MTDAPRTFGPGRYSAGAPSREPDRTAPVRRAPIGRILAISFAAGIGAGFALTLFYVLFR